VAEQRARWPLALAMGAGLATAAGAAAVAVSSRSAAKHRSLVDDRAGDAAAFDLDALGVTRHTIATHDGGELLVVEKGPTDARPLVLLHGITLQARIWGYQLRDLSDRYRVVAVDLRGHGASRPGREGYGLPLLARDLRTVLEALDLRRAIVVGHSMGGMTLMQFCADHPDVLDERVAGCVFLATAPVVPLPPLVQAALRRLQPSLHRLGRRPTWERIAGAPRPGDLDYNLARRVFGRRASPLHVELTSRLVSEMAPSAIMPTGLGLVAHDAEAALARTHTPSLVIGGELDRLLPPALSRRIADSLPDARLHILDGAGHQLMLERPQEVAALLDAFAEGLG
jgi:pimeloyl-ACP methyl ester carboxylesterase